MPDRINPEDYPKSYSKTCPKSQDELLKATKPAKMPNSAYPFSKKNKPPIPKWKDVQDRNENGTLKKGNRLFHRLGVVEGMGRPKALTLESIIEGATEYMDYIDSNPLTVKRTKVSGNGEVVEYNEEYPRAYFENELAAWLGINKDGWFLYRKNPEFSSIIETIVQEFNNSKLNAAMNGVYKENIVARLLGLTDKSESKLTVEAVTDRVSDKVNTITQSLHAEPVTIEHKPTQGD